MNWVFIGILLFIIVITPLALGIKKSIEGYTDGFNYCHTDDADYNSPNSCYDISYNDISGNKKSGKARIYGDYYISYDGYLKEVPDKTLYVPADNKIGYGPKGTSGITLCERGDPNYGNTAVCKVANYYDLKKNKVTAPMRLSNRVYLDASGFVKQVPYGYIANAEQNGFMPKTDSETYSSAADHNWNIPKDTLSGTSYNTDNLDITYHTDPTENGSPDDSQAGPGKMWVKDNSGNLIAIPYTDVSNTTLYYAPGSYKFGPSNYVPNYEESVYLSKLTNEPTTSSILDAPYLKSGFCEADKSFPNKIEEKCNSLNEDTCASTKCCLLLGGQKCVAGSENGPTNPSNYSNFQIINRDYYYYQGKCYGNCEK